MSRAPSSFFHSKQRSRILPQHLEAQRKELGVLIEQDLGGRDDKYRNVSFEENGPWSGNLRQREQAELH
jgi:hypothetical protein